jgi:UrcA family protein
MKKLTIPLGAGLCLAALAPPASAQAAPAQIVTNIGVSHSDLDLESAQGVQAMLARLDRAATEACGGKPAPVMPGDQVGMAKQGEHRRCKAAAMESSTLRLGSPPVRAAWLGKRERSTVPSQESLGGGAP